MFSIFISVYILLFSSGGLFSLQKSKSGIAKQRSNLQKLCIENLELAKEVRRFTVKDPELYESLARQRGLGRTGETIYTFYNDNSNDDNSDD